MAETVILDAGPLVAYLDRSEEHHSWAVDAFDRLMAPVLSCEAVITEACFLLARHPQALARIDRFLERGIIRLDFSLSKERTAVFALMRKYHDVPMSLADACLLRLAETHAGARIFTLDTDFKIYRMTGRKTVPLIAPFDD